MAWKSSGKTNLELIANMTSNNLIHNERVSTAMSKVDRANYVVDKSDAYRDSPQYIGHGATISAPHMHAHAVENLLPLLRTGARVLDVGSGSGYLLAVFHNLVAPLDPETGGIVVGIEHVDELVNWSTDNLRADGLASAIDRRQIIVVAGDGRKGYPLHAPYDAIHVGAAASFMPQDLVEQLACPGRMFVPVGPDGGPQEVFQVDKDADGRVEEKRLFGVMYVPLTDRKNQK
ncbi:protein-L-isoaspartate O-methyltransferase [Amylostereum chailletii]|nr:protein-L-isoaspartate O-methyltransferase [Amylostereum chailletii]